MNRPNFTKLQWKIEKIVRNFKKPVEKLFQMGVYYFKLVCIWGKEKVLLLKFCPQNGWDYDKLEWPFRAEFTIRSELTIVLSRSKCCKNEFKTEVIEVGKEQFKSCTDITIAVIDEDTFPDDYVRNITFEIYVIQ